MYSRMRGGLRGSVGVSAPYDRVAGLVGHSHAMTEWTMLGQETPPRVCVWPGRLHLRRSVKAAAYPKKKLCATSKSDSRQPRVKELSTFTLTQSGPHCLEERHYSLVGFFPLSFSSGRTGKVFFPSIPFLFLLSPLPSCSLARDPS